MSWQDAYDGFEYARRYGFVVDGPVPWTGYRAKPGSHDDGPDHGPFLGGFGTGCFSRDVQGRFSRWHLQPGLHVVQPVPQARMLLRWDGGEPGAADYGGARFLLTGEAPGWESYQPMVPGFPDAARSYAVLFPDCYEYYADPEIPVEVLLHYWSPLVPGDEEAASRPVVYFSVHLRNRGDRPLRVGVSFFWPNLLGWRASRVPSVDRGDRSWPGQTHSGNTARPGSAGAAGDSGGTAGRPGLAVIQERRPAQHVVSDVEGQVALLVGAEDGAELTRELCMKCDLNAVAAPPAEQMYTQAWCEQYFLDHGSLPGTEASWDAHWHEPLSSALAASVGVPADGESVVQFTLAWDMPLVVFGAERAWEKRYTADFDASGRNAEAILSEAVTRRGQWRRELDTRRGELLDPAFERTTGTVLNELFLSVGNGTAWVAREHRQDIGLGPPRLGVGEHFGFLEGFDTGYYYYNTLDLWVYAFPALSLTWPDIADRVFSDFLVSLRTPDPRERIV
jgi:uncharacterized protein (DUF608 family)